ncbi:hypothetical protein IG631_07482 [Alternaria alternata]|nr:hypothetical protein IG631_07482 [Alternaria alternata]
MRYVWFPTGKPIGKGNSTNPILFKHFTGEILPLILQSDSQLIVQVARAKALKFEPV